MKKTVEFTPTISPRQGSGPRVVCFCATPQEIAAIARIDRIARDGEGNLTGFQRPQISSHIREIRRYLERDDAMLPNSIVIAFSGKAKLSRTGGLAVDVSNGPPGWVVDGQQRLSAALSAGLESFEFVVSAFLCEDAAELNRQFILINNTRPLAKPLIYELLPGVDGLPERLANRAEAALLIEALNFGPNSSLRGQILQQTNPDGVIKDTLLQRFLMNSLQHGMLRHVSDSDLRSKGFKLLSDYFAAVQSVFGAEWVGHTPRSSRLLHGTGIVALGYVFDELAIREKAKTVGAFSKGLRRLAGHTHWTSGEWEFGAERRGWNTLQNTQADYRLLSHYLVRLIRRGG